MQLTKGKMWNLPWPCRRPQRRIYNTTVLLGQLSTTFRNAPEVPQLPTPSCIRRLPAPDNDVRDRKSKLLTVTHRPWHDSTSWAPLAEHKCSTTKESEVVGSKPCILWILCHPPQCQCRRGSIEKIWNSYCF